ncbi:SOS response-associated peptidase [Pseudomonas sp. BN414]|uniref:SOS response-associated peptidase n=1 Tax=Pseudomonas sp. BN414 TaxID=2567888 RepID=UPI0024560F72|nr:SOS response-associated peptidase [Pseudomonas sp. BN414]MDH4570465.1 SOS response-associated peptidase [Pseudomonas sp. BN414]
MCGRYVSPGDWAIEHFWHIGARKSERWIESFNVAPTMQVPMLCLTPQGELELVAARWDLIPFWWTQPKPPDFSFNARSEAAATMPMWRQSLRTHRCLMLALGWYEWNKHQQVRGRSGYKTNQPYYHHGIDNGVLAIAGLWSTWFGPEGQKVVSCAMLTRDAAPSVAFVHHRMPVILPAEQFDLWLSPSTPIKQVEDAVALSREDFFAYPVSTEVNNIRNDSSKLLKPVEIVPMA